MSLAQVDTDNQFPPSYSMVEDNILAGSGVPKMDVFPVQLDNLWQKNIRGILSLTEDSLPTAIMEAKGYIYLHLPTVDLTPPTLLQLAEGVRFIDRVHAETDGGTLVHCREGVGRTGTMLAAWFVMSKGMEGQCAIDHVRSLRAGALHQKHQELRIHQLSKVCESQELREKLDEGTLDESNYDFRLVKAATAQVMGRTTDSFLKRFYYARWLSFTAVENGWVKEEGCPDPHAKFLETERSPTWKPRLQHFHAPPPEAATPSLCISGEEGKAPGAAGVSSSGVLGTRLSLNQAAATDLPASAAPSPLHQREDTGGRKRNSNMSPSGSGLAQMNFTEQRYYGAADAAYAGREIAPGRKSISNSPLAAKRGGKDLPQAAAAAEAPAAGGGGSSQSPEQQSVEAKMMSRAGDLAYLQDQQVPKLVLEAVKALLEERPDSPRQFLAKFFGEQAQRHLTVST